MENKVQVKQKAWYAFFSSELDTLPDEVEYRDIVNHLKNNFGITRWKFNVNPNESDIGYLTFLTKKQAFEWKVRHG